MDQEEIREEESEVTEIEETEAEAPALDPPKFSANTVINAEIQREASEAVASKNAKYVSYGCIALVVVAFGLLVWQYVATRTTTGLLMLLLSALVVFFLIYSQVTMPKKAIARWEASMRRSFGTTELHLTTEFYNLSLAQSVQEDGSVNVQGYSDISELRESEHLFLLRRSKQQWFFVAKDGFTVGNAEDFRSFITDRIEGK